MIIVYKKRWHEYNLEKITILTHALPFQAPSVGVKVLSKITAREMGGCFYLSVSCMRVMSLAY